MKNKYNDEKIENEINSLIDLVLHLDPYLFKGQTGLSNLNQKISKLELSNNSSELIQEIISSDKTSYYLCYDDTIKKIRNDRGIMKAINEVFKKEEGKEDSKQVIRKINSYGFNQSGLYNNQAFYSNQAEFYFLKNFIHSKILNIIKSSFELQFNKKKQVNRYNNRYKKKSNFILISHSCLRNAQLMNEYIENNQNLYLSNYYIRLTNSKLLNPINFKYLKKSLSRSQINLYDNNKSKIFNLYKNNKNTSYVNSSDFNINKNSSSSCDKSSNKILDFNSVNIINSNNNQNKFITKKNIRLLNKRKKEEQENNYFFPMLSIKDNNYQKNPKLMRYKLPSFNSDKMELINYNTKNNIQIKNEQTFLNECLKESYRSLRNIKDLQRSKCFVDYSKSSIMSDKLSTRRKEQAPPKEKAFFPGFEYKSIYKYTFNGKLNLNKKNTIV